MLLYTNAQMPYTCTIFDKILKTDGDSRQTTQNGSRPVLKCHLIDIDDRSYVISIQNLFHYVHNTSTSIVADSDVPTVLLTAQLYDPDLPLSVLEIM